MKNCTKCEKTKDDLDFFKNKNKKDGLQQWCKTCLLEAQKAERLRNPEKTIEKSKKYYRKNIKKSREKCKKWYNANRGKAKLHSRRRLLKSYGLSIDQYDAMLIKQGGLCAICNQPSHKSLQVDHCHDTGKVRGLLCSGCNKGIGLLGDSSRNLFSASNYLLKFGK